MTGDLNPLKEGLLLEGWGNSFELAPEDAFYYADWLCCPAPLRDPPTRAEWSEQNGVNPRLRNQLEEHPEFQRMCIMRNKANGFSQMSVNMVNENLERAASNPNRPDVRAIELFLRQTGNLRPVESKNLNIGVDLTEMSTEELEAEVGKLRHRQLNTGGKVIDIPDTSD